MKKCIICDRTNLEVSILIQGDNEKCICNECIRVFDDLLTQYSLPVVRNKKKDRIKVMKPNVIKSILDNKVIGQDEAKMLLSVAAYNHELLWDGKIADGFRKDNIIIVGSTGVGKTYLVEQIADILEIPIIICDATTYSEVGYEGEDVNQILVDLLRKADFDISKAEKGIVFLDEVDKLRKTSSGLSYSRDVSGEGVQQSILKMIEGKTFSLSIQTSKGIQVYTINTRNILFVLCGAFVGLNTEYDLSEALINYGMLPELVGRTPLLVRMNNLTKNDLMQILTELDDSPINYHKKLFALDGIHLEISKEVLLEIAAIAEKKQLGARGLFSIVDKIMYPLRFICIQKEVKHIDITHHMVETVLNGDMMSIEIDA